MAPDPTPHDLPQSVSLWPRPTGRKTRPARWFGTPASFTELMESTLSAGEDALASVWNDAPRGAHSPLTRWFTPQVPMHASGQTSTADDGRVWHEYLVPARAALQAMQAGMVTFHPGKAGR